MRSNSEQKSLRWRDPDHNSLIRNNLDKLSEKIYLAVEVNDLMK